jgi:nucleotide-binding universal stress UspA family protein
VFQIRKILHGTDLSPPAMAAFAIARDLARQNGALLLVLHVAPPAGPEQVSFAEAEHERQPESYLAHLRTELETRFGSDADPMARCLVVEGKPVDAISRVAAEQSCDLIVVGTHGWGPWHRLLLGSTAERLVRAAPCPVLTVKLPATEAGHRREE